MKTKAVRCASCKTQDCAQGVDRFGGRSDPRPHLDDEDLRLLKCASQIEAEFYMKMTRLEELIELCERMEYKRIGVAFCIGLSREAKVLCAVLERRFDVFSACCKNCGLDKDELGLAKIRPGNFEAMCNPVGQALLLDGAGTDLNLTVGLCVGHDMLFNKHSKAPVSAFAVKDRVLAHNPLGAIYSRYYLKNRFRIDPADIDSDG